MFLTSLQVFKKWVSHVQRRRRQKMTGPIFFIDVDSFSRFGFSDLFRFLLNRKPEKEVRQVFCSSVGCLMRKWKMLTNMERKEANQDLIEIENLDSQKNSVSFIKEYFEKIKRKVNMRRDVLKVKIDLYSDRIIQTIDKTE